MGMRLQGPCHHLMLAFGMEEVQGPEEVINGIPLNVATPLSSVKRCCIHREIMVKIKIVQPEHLLDLYFISEETHSIYELVVIIFPEDM